MKEMIQVVDGQLVADSRLFAPKLDIRHRSIMANINKYQSEFKELGILRFKIAEIDGRGQPEKYCLLNEDQANLLLVLSRNTYNVVKLKLQLTKLFRDMRASLNHSGQLLTEANRITKVLNDERDFASECGKGLAHWRHKRNILEHRIKRIEKEAQLMLNFNS